MSCRTVFIAVLVCAMFQPATAASFAAEPSGSPDASSRVESYMLLHNGTELIQFGLDATRNVTSAKDPWSVSLWVWYSNNPGYGPESAHSWEITNFELPQGAYAYSYHGQTIRFTADLTTQDLVPVQCRDVNGNCGFAALKDLGRYFPGLAIDIEWSIGDPIPEASGTINVHYQNLRHELARSSSTYETHRATARGSVLGHGSGTFYLERSSVVFWKETSKATSSFILAPVITFPPDPTLPPEP